MATRMYTTFADYYVVVLLVLLVRIDEAHKDIDNNFLKDAE